MAMRFRSDLAEFRTTKVGMERAVIAFLWALTAIAAWVVFSFARDVVVGITGL